jgi:hypothetical protein
MSSLWQGNRRAYKFYGSRNIRVYSAEKIYEETAFIGYYLHWSREEIFELPHAERVRWCNEISKINCKINESNGSSKKNIFSI